MPTPAPGGSNQPLEFECSTPGANAGIGSAGRYKVSHPDLDSPGRDANGFADTEQFYLLVNTNTSTQAVGCHGYYDRASNSLSFMRTALAGTLTPGEAGTIQNSQCDVDGSASSVSASGTDLVLNLNITRQGSYLGGFTFPPIWITGSANRPPEEYWAVIGYSDSRSADFSYGGISVRADYPVKR